jgi:hypothetical protein
VDSGGVDFDRIQGGTISGHVSDADGDVADVYVEACNLAETICFGGWTGENGFYTIYGILPDDYRVSVAGDQGGWIDQFYELTSDWSLATPVSVTAGVDTGGIDFDMVLDSPP